MVNLNITGFLFYTTIFTVISLNCVKTLTKTTELKRFGSNISKFPQNKQVNLKTYQNLFSSCLLHIINYKNIDVKFNNDIPTPIVISRYFVLKVKYMLETKKIIEYETQVSIFPVEKYPKKQLT